MIFNKSRFQKNKWPVFLLAFTFITLALYFGFFFDTILYSFKKKSHFIYNVPTSPTAYQHGKPNTNYFSSDIPKISFKIKNEELEKILKIRDRIIFNEKTIDDNDKKLSKSKVKIEFEGEKYSGVIRLKGYTSDHLKTDQWSFIVKVKKGAILGMREFSLMHPWMRFYLNEKIFQETVKSFGLMGLKYDFVHVSINNKNMGIYAIEERFNAQLIEGTNHRKSGLIVRLSDNPFSDEVISNNYNANDISQKANLNKVSSLIKDFKLGKILTDQYVDLEKFAKFCALIDFMGAHHGAFFDTRFYFNPVISRFEPIAYDSNTSGNLDNLVATQRIPFDWFNYFFKNDENYKLHKLYIRELRELAQYSSFNKIINTLSSAIFQREVWLSKAFPGYNFTLGDFFFPTSPSGSTFDLLAEGSSRVQKKLDASSAISGFYIKNRNNKKLELYLGSNHELPVEIFEISETIMPENIILKGRINFLSSKPVLSQFNFKNKMGFKNEKAIKIKYRLLGDSIIYKCEIFPFFENRISFGSIEKKDFPWIFVKYNSKDSIYTIPKGTWIVDRPWHIQKNKKLMVEPGTKIVFQKDGQLTSKSPVFFIGTKSSPIELNLKNNSNILILESDQISTFQNTNITGETPALKSQTSNIIIRNSNVFIKNLKLFNLNSKWPLFFLSSEVNIENIEINRNYQNGIYFSYSNGTLKNIKISNLLNDGMLFQASQFLIKNLHVSTMNNGVVLTDNSYVEINKADFITGNNAMVKLNNSEIKTQNTQTKNHQRSTFVNPSPENFFSTR